MKRINLNEIENIPELCKKLKVYSNKILPPKGYSAITLYPFIVIRGSKDEAVEYLKTARGRRTLNHERLHELQVLDIGIIKFYVLYVYYYIVLRFKGFNSQSAYYNIPFEREAYANDENFYFCKTEWRSQKYMDSVLNNNKLQITDMA
jgi:hypothetical protein